MTDDCESCKPNEQPTTPTSRGASIFIAVLLGYFISPVPVAYGLMKVGAFERLEKPFYVVYAPVSYAANRFELVGKFYRWQERLFDL